MTSPTPRTGDQVVPITRALDDMPAPKRGPAVQALGRTGWRLGSEHLTFDDPVLAQLRGPQAIKTFEKMGLDPTIAGILELFRLLLSAPKWTVEPGADDDLSKRFADRVSAMFDAMDPGWSSIIGEASDALLFGFHLHEIVYQVFDDGFVGWDCLLAYDPRTLLRWHKHPQTGRMVAVTQQALTTSPVDIESWKLLHFRPRPVSGRPEGRSLARNAFLAWSDKTELRRITKVGLRRDLTGMAVLEVPSKLLEPDPSPEDQAALTAAEELVREVERDIREGVIIPTELNEDGKPSGWKLRLLQSAGRRSIELDKRFSQLRQEVAIAMVADFILLGTESVGSYALGSAKKSTMTRAVGAYLERMKENVEHRSFPVLQALNPEFMRAATPVLRYGEIDDLDLDDVGSFLQKAGVHITPDDNLEGALRTRAGLPQPVGESEL